MCENQYNLIFEPIANILGVWMRFAIYTYYCVLKLFKKSSISSYSFWQWVGYFLIVVLFVVFSMPLPVLPDLINVRLASSFNISHFFSLFRIQALTSAACQHVVSSLHRFVFPFRFDSCKVSFKLCLFLFPFGFCLLQLIVSFTYLNDLLYRSCFSVISSSWLWAKLRRTRYCETHYILSWVLNLFFKQWFVHQPRLRGPVYSTSVSGHARTGLCSFTLIVFESQ